MENVKEPQVITAGVKKLRRTKEWRRKVIVGALIAVGAAVIMFAGYLMFNGRIATDGLITILIVTIFGLVFGISFLERIGV